MLTSNVLSCAGTTLAMAGVPAGGVNVSETTMSGRNPAPWTAIGSPVRPQVGFNVSEGHGTRKGALAAAMTNSPCPPCAVTVYGEPLSAVPTGTRNVALKVPPGAWMAAPFTVATVAPLKMIRMSVPGTNEEPVTCTVAPTEPHVGDSVIAGGGAAANRRLPGAIRARLRRPSRRPLAGGLVASHQQRAGLARTGEADRLIGVDLDRRHEVIVEVAIVGQ